MADRFEGGIHRTVAFGGGGDVFAVHFHLDGGFRRAAGAADHFHGHELQTVVLIFAAAGAHKCDHVVVKHLFLAVSQLFEAHKDVLELVVTHFKAELLQLVAQGGAAGVFPQRQGGAGEAHVFGAHDLEGLFVLQHAVLVDAAFMGKGVFADDGLVELHREAGHGGHTAGDVHELGGVDAGAPGHDVVAHFQGHHNFFERGVACAFAQTVDGAFDLACAACDCGQRVGGRHAKVVVAVGGEDHLIRARHSFDQAS